VGSFNTTMILERFEKNVNEMGPDLVIILEVVPMKLPQKLGELFARGAVCERKEKNNQAVLWYRKALKDKPGFPEAYDALARVYFLIGNKKESKENSKRFIEADPIRKRAYVEFAARFVQDPIWDKEDIQFIRRYVRVNPVVGDILKLIKDNSKHGQKIGN